MSAFYEYKKCPHCSTELPLAANYCLECGRLPVVKEEKKRAEPPVQTAGPEWRFHKFDDQLYQRLCGKRSSLADTGHLQAALVCRKLLQQSGGFQFKTLHILPFMPRDYQLQAVRRVLGNMGGNAILADEVGLGKTVEAGLIINELLAREMAKKVLIITPAALMEQWQQELAEKFSLEAGIIRELPDKWPDVVIISHQRVRSGQYATLVNSLNWDLVIVDEAQILRNSNTQLYRFLYKLPRRYTLLLTATPLQNNLYELYHLIQLVHPGHFRSKRFFKRRFMDEGLAVRNADILQESCSRVMVRNRRVSTLVPIPVRKVENIQIELSEAEDCFYQFIVELARLLYQTEVLSDKWGSNRLEQSRWLLIVLVLLKESTSSPSAVLGTMASSIINRIDNEAQRQLATRIMQQGGQLGLSAKMRALLRLLRQWDPREKVIIYTEYMATMDKLEQVLSMAGYRVVTFNGRQNAKTRLEKLNQFKNDVPILISSEVGGQGLNLQFCFRLVNYDLPWNPMRVEQRIGRVHRLGQQHPVEIYNIVAFNTFEGYLLQLLWAKIGLFTRVIGEIDSILSYLKDDSTIEQRIGQAILESGENEQIKSRFSALAKEVEEAQLLFDNDQKMTATILDLNGEEIS